MYSITKGSCQNVCHNISSDVIKNNLTTYFGLQICNDCGEVGPISNSFDDITLKWTTSN